MNKLYLPDVTLCSIESLNVALGIWSMERTIRHVDFGAALLLTDHLPCLGTTVPIQQIEPEFVTKKDYEHFAIKRLPNYITTKFVLTIEWDSFVIDPASWTDE